MSLREWRAVTTRSGRSFVRGLVVLLTLVPLVSVAQGVPHLCQAAFAARSLSCPCVHEQNGQDEARSSTVERPSCCEVTQSPVNASPAVPLKPGVTSPDVSNALSPTTLEVQAKAWVAVLVPEAARPGESRPRAPLYLSLRTILR